MFRRLKQIIIGRPLLTEEIHEQTLSKKAALTVFSSDALSSTAYATDEILLALMVAGAAALSLALPTAILIVILLVIVVTSYGQTIHAYPTGGGAYTVAKENLGVGAGLVAGAALLVDYVLTVAVSVAAGIAAITSAVPALYPERVWLCLLAIFIVLAANLRGVRESAALFAMPVYFFIVSAYVLVIGGLVQYFRSPQPIAPPEAVAAAPVGWLAAVLILRAFSSGCAALTGVEAVSNGVRAFKPPVSKNASVTLYIMAAILGTLFLGATIIARLYGIVPHEGETVLSQLGHRVFGASPIYYAIQLASMFILVLAANTSFADFPRLASILARDRFLPRQFANLGDRLVFSNGIIILGLAAGFLVVLFGGSVHRLIPLYAIGVFLSFTLWQAGMVVHWKSTGGRGWRRRLVINAIGAVATAVVVFDLAIFKFVHGAWVVLVILPLQVWVFRKIREHYFLVSMEVSVADYERPRQIKHTVVVPVPGINKVVLAAIEYARSISRDVIAVLVNVDGREREELLKRWQDFAGDVPLVVLEAPHRSILRPLLRFIDEVGKIRDDDVVTVVLPESVPARWWHYLLHNQTSLLIKGALLFKPKIVVTSIPHHLGR